MTDEGSEGSTGVVASSASHLGGSGQETSSAEDRDSVIFRELYRDLRRFAAVCSAPEVDPDDVVQEAVAKTLARHRLADLDNPGAYLRSAIANLARDAYRRGRHERRVPPAPVSTQDSYPSQLAELGRLTPDERAAVYLVDVERITIDEAAQLLGWPVNELRAQRRRGRRKLRLP